MRNNSPKNTNEIATGNSIVNKKKRPLHMISGGQSSIIGLGGGNKKPNKLFKPNPSGVGSTLLTYK